MIPIKAQIAQNLFAKDWFTQGESAQIIETIFELSKQFSSAQASCPKIFLRNFFD